MTDETRAYLRRKIEEVVRWSALHGASVEDTYEAEQQDGNNIVGVQIEVWDRNVDDDTVPPLTPWQHLFLSALLGESVQPAVLLGALEDSGVYPDGVVRAAVEGARAEERERCAKVCEVEADRLNGVARDRIADGWENPFQVDEADGASRCADLIRGV